METISRRNFLGTAAAAGSISMLASSACIQNASSSRMHPLDGIERENIKITDVKVFLLSYELPPEKQWVTSQYLCWKADEILIQVYTDTGIVGNGSASQYGGMERVKKYTEEVIRPNIVGKNPFDVEMLTCGMYTFGAQVAWAGVDAALWDIIGKSKNMPVYKLLATDIEPDPRVKLYASGGVEYAWYDRPEDLIDEALRHKENGYKAFKFRIGTEWKNSNITMKTYIPFIRKIREAVGPDFNLMQEANMRWDLKQCLEIAPALEELKFLWFEEPVNRFREGAIEDHITINKALQTVMVSGGETMTNRFQFKEWVDRDAYDIVQPDCNTTGITEGWYIARMANMKGKPCCPHSWHGGFTMMANANLVAGIPNRLMLEHTQTFNPLREEILKGPFNIVDGHLILSDKPGLGADPIDNIAQKYPYIPGSYSRVNPNLPK